jgi:hypothetical protein
MSEEDLFHFGVEKFDVLMKTDAQNRDRLKSLYPETE